MAMLFVPLLLFHLGVPIVRTLEKLWFAVLILFLAIAWSFWSADYCNRIAEDRITPATVGVAVLITIATIMFSAMPRWKNGQCLTGHSLHPTILMIALQLLFFGIISTAIGFAALKMALGGRKATMGIPDWFGYIIPLVPLLIQIVFSLSAKAHYSLLR